MAGNSNSVRPKNPPKARELLKNVIPIKEMFNDDEIIIYESLIDIYLKDFDEDDLTSSDLEIVFLEIRKKSSGESVETGFYCPQENCDGQFKTKSVVIEIKPVFGAGPVKISIEV